MSTRESVVGPAAVDSGVVANRDALFVASCVALIVTAMSFAIRGALIDPLGTQFGLSKQQIGLVAGTAFWGFTLAMIFGGPLCDVIGMKRLLMFAFVGHLVGIIGTIFAGGFLSFFLSTLAFGLANGFVEAACNPLIATLYPDQKIKRLSLFHAWFPGGIVIGGVVAYLVGPDVLNLGGKEHYWQVQMASMLLPLIVYGLMFAGKKLPQTERVASGVSTSQMFAACASPFFLLFVVCMLMTAATELGTTQWLPNILTYTTGGSGILFLVWINGLMACGRLFAGPIVHRMSPIGMLIGSAFFSTIGLFLLSRAHDLVSAAVATTIFAVGVCFFWPTMLGVVSERFPRTGALGLAIMGGAGMLSTAIILPVIGRQYDKVTAQSIPAGKTLEALKAAKPGTSDAAAWIQAQAAGGAAGLQVVIILPILLLAIFTAIYLYDRARGGYKKEVLEKEVAA